MFCGLCVEPCPTGAIQHTREFEGAAMHFDNLTLRFVPDPDAARCRPYKVPKGAGRRSRAATLGEITTQADQGLGRAAAAVPVGGRGRERTTASRRRARLDIRPRWAHWPPRRCGVKDDKLKLQKVLEEAMAGTDCGDCGYPDCFGYSDAIAQGKEIQPGEVRAGRRRFEGDAGDDPGLAEDRDCSRRPRADQPAPAEPPALPRRLRRKRAPKGPPLAQTLSKDELVQGGPRRAWPAPTAATASTPTATGTPRASSTRARPTSGRCAPGGEDTRQKLYEIMLGTKPPPK